MESCEELWMVPESFASASWRQSQDGIQHAREGRISGQSKAFRVHFPSMPFFLSFFLSFFFPFWFLILNWDLSGDTEAVPPLPTRESKSLTWWVLAFGVSSVYNGLYTVIDNFNSFLFIYIVSSCHILLTSNKERTATTATLKLLKRLWQLCFSKLTTFRRSPKDSIVGHTEIDRKGGKLSNSVDPESV